MPEYSVERGKITKVVHVRFAANGAGDKTNLVGCDGYGILQGTNGRDVFFIDTALQDARFSDLQTGQEVLYVIESSPLHRAAKIWVSTSASQLRNAGTEVSVKCCQRSEVTEVLPLGEHEIRDDELGRIESDGVN